MIQTKPALVIVVAKNVPHLIERKPRDPLSQLFMSVEKLLGITYRIKHDLHIMPSYSFGSLR